MCLKLRVGEGDSLSSRLTSGRKLRGVGVSRSHGTSVALQLLFALCQCVCFFFLTVTLFCVCVCVCVFSVIVALFICCAAAYRSPASVWKALVAHRSLVVIPIARFAKLHARWGASERTFNETHTRAPILQGSSFRGRLFCT